MVYGKLQVFPLQMRRSLAAFLLNMALMVGRAMAAKVSNKALVLSCA